MIITIPSVILGYCIPLIPFPNCFNMLFSVLESICSLFS
jgi:hypothetical protein